MKKAKKQESKKTIGDSLALLLHCFLALLIIPSTEQNGNRHKTPCSKLKIFAKLKISLVNFGLWPRSKGRCAGRVSKDVTRHNFVKLHNFE